MSKYGDKFKISTNKTHVCAERLEVEVGKGWGMDLKLKCYPAEPWVFVNVSSLAKKTTERKCVTPPQCAVCEKNAGNSAKRVNSDYKSAPDKFNITNEDGKVCVKRIDQTDPLYGWGMQLMLKCSPCPTTTVTETTTETTTVTTTVTTTETTTVTTTATTTVATTITPAPAPAPAPATTAKCETATLSKEVTVDIGSNGCKDKKGCAKCAKVAENVCCKKDAASPENRKNTWNKKKAKDVFEVTQEGVDVCVSRTDLEKQDDRGTWGWGMPLKITCYEI